MEIKSLKGRLVIGHKLTPMSESVTVGFYAPIFVIWRVLRPLILAHAHFILLLNGVEGRRLQLGTHEKGTQERKKEGKDKREREKRTN